MSEKFPTFLSEEDKFKQKINGRYEIWTSLTNDAPIEEKTKQKIQEILTKYKEGAYKIWDNPNDASYYTISSLLSTINEDRHKESAEAKSLFENLRDDIWELHNETKK